ncbi:MAG: nuclear transport factor 2 family protein, partial [Acidobacteriota bacterium]|nr:nuclear transport factor 2 family protein [Acidobacteriota bacterium]
MKRVLLTSLLAIVACSLTIHIAPVESEPKQKSDAELEVLKVDEEFRIAKLKNDTATLERILAVNVDETNQYGSSTNKAQLIELFTHFKPDALTTNESQVRITGDTAAVTESQTETDANGVERMLFMRVYVREQGRWQLFASMQFRDPKLERCLRESDFDCVPEPKRLQR